MSISDRVSAFNDLISALNTYVNSGSGGDAVWNEFRLQGEAWKILFLRKIMDRYWGGCSYS
ncbi:MAG: hypothetical protein LBD32_01200 [Cytophagales bacterium]|jgi:hypothetical protein|nr:hypothetical protein [Cytophagales bacterium]